MQLLNGAQSLNITLLLVLFAAASDDDCQPAHPTHTLNARRALPGATDISCV